MNACVASFRQRLFIQAAITGIFALLPSNSGDNGWLMITVVLAVACAGIAVALPSLGAAAYQTALGFELVAVLMGGYALTQDTYIPGTIVGIAALIRLLDSSVKAAFVAGSGHAPTVAQAPYGQQYAPQPLSGQQFGVPQQYGGQQYGAPQPAPQQYAAPQPYAPPQQYAAPQQYSPQQPPPYAPPSSVPPPPPTGSWPPPAPPA